MNKKRQHGYPFENEPVSLQALKGKPLATGI